MTNYKHLIRMGTNAEKKYCRDFQNQYDAIVINANILAHTTSSMSSFLGCELSKDFLIDPQTYAFQSYGNLLQTSKGKTPNANIKKSISSMLTSYGEKIKKIIEEEKRSISYNDFLGEEGEAFLHELSDNVIDFQLNTIQNQSLENSEYGEYIQYELASNTQTVNLKPFALIPPYFYMTENTVDNWILHNTNAIKYCKEKFCDETIYAQIVINKEILLNTGIIDKIIKYYSSTNADGYFIWIDSFDEKNIGQTYLNNFIYFLKNLKNCNKPIYQIYGSYFSIMLTKDCLSGTCHGMEYGETREVFPVGGGIPVSKFYMPDLHKRLLYRDALEFLLAKKYLVDKATYFSNVCDCKTCKQVINDNPEIDFSAYGDFNSTTFKRKAGNREYSVTMDYPTTEAKDLCLKHYLFNKTVEYEYVNTKNWQELIQQLLEAHNNSCDILGDDVDYLLTWANVIKSNFIEDQEI